MERSLLNFKKELSNEEKAAVLLASLDQKLAATVMQQLEPKLMMRITGAVRSLGMVPVQLRNKTITECLNDIKELSSAVQGDDSLATSLLVQAVGEKKASSLMSENQSESKGPFTAMATLSAEQIASVISREQPIVMALVIKHLPAELAAGVLRVLPSDARKRTIVHICTAGSPSEDVVARIEAMLTSKIPASAKAARKSAEASDKITGIAAILQHSEKPIEEELLTAIAEQHEALATQIRDRLFTFEDIARLSDPAIRRIMQEIDSSVLAMALRNANADLKQKFFQNMSKRAAEGLREEMEFAQKVKRSEVEAKQREIVSVIRTLESDGQLSTGTSDDYV